MKLDYYLWAKALNIPPISLKAERAEVDTSKKDEYLTVELRYVPTNENSAKYKKNVRYYKGNCPKAHLEFVDDIHKVLVGQNITEGPQQFAMTRTLLRGDALRIFDLEKGNLIGPEDAETPAALTRVINALGTVVFPTRALVKQKRYMRRFLRKPLANSWRQFIAEVIEMNDNLEYYPPFGTDQKLSEAEILEILEFASPMGWQKRMIEHNFNCAARSIAEVIEFGERQETLESIKSDGRPAKIPKKGTQKASEYKHKGGKPYRAKSSEEAKYKYNHQPKRSGKPVCQLHGPGHWTDECKVLKDHIGKLRAQHDARFQGNNYNKKYAKRDNKKRAYIPRDEINQLLKQAKVDKHDKMEEGEVRDAGEELNQFDKLQIRATGSDSSDSWVSL